MGSLQGGIAWRSCGLFNSGRAPMKRCNNFDSSRTVMHERGKAQPRPAKSARATGCSTALDQQQQHLQEPHSAAADATPSSKTALWEMLHLIRTINAVNEVSASIDAAGAAVPAAAMPATLTAANTSLAACQRAVGLVSELMEASGASETGVLLADKALRVAEAAVAATCRRLRQAQRLAAQVQQQQAAAAAAAARGEDEELTDTCSSCSCSMPLHLDLN
ncbi:hypothetical protein OEZ86_010561 [Tetradesmus obliquus]|nr:hypothetical protein OEZ86_010561 [Tetradesmus obliquus]